MREGSSLFPVVFVGRLSLGSMGLAEMGEKSKRSKDKKRPNAKCIFLSDGLCREQRGLLVSLYQWYAHLLAQPSTVRRVSHVCNRRLTTLLCGMKDSRSRDSASQQAGLHGLIIGRRLFNRSRHCQIYSTLLTALPPSTASPRVLVASA